MTPEKEEEFMNNTGWKVLGLESDTRIAEFKAENPDDKLLSYVEAKADALKRLKDHVAPYLARIEELEQDELLETGALPPLKAWRYDYGPSCWDFLRQDGSYRPAVSVMQTYGAMP